MMTGPLLCQRENRRFRRALTRVTARLGAGRWSGSGAPQLRADSRQAGERFPFNRAISCRAPFPLGPVSFIAELNGGARLRARATSLEPSRRSRTLRKDAAMSGALSSLQSAHDMAASSAVAGAHGRGLARAELTVLAVAAPRVKGRGRARRSPSASGTSLGAAARIAAGAPCQRLAVLHRAKSGWKLPHAKRPSSIK